MVMLQPGIAVIYDELEASEAARWEWLLHSPVEFAIDAEKGIITTENKTDRNHCRVTLMTSSEAEMTKTSKFLVPPATQGASYPDQWHFTAKIDGQPSVRVLAIIQPSNIADEFSEVRRDGDSYVIDDWRVTANLDPASPATLNIENTRTGAVLDAGTSATVSTLSGATYRRGYTNSTLIVDGKTLELVDEAQMGSRSIR